MVDRPRLTLQTYLVLNALFRDMRGEKYGLEVAKEARLPSGTIYPILARLEAAGWLESGWEDIDESAEGRRKRRYYRLTGHGISEARRAIESTRTLMFPDLAGVKA
jgi:PadR family transcriptional regulator, regulatory protein PadR